MDRPLPIKDGWYLLPGDNKNDRDQGTRTSLMWGQPHMFFWTYVSAGRCIGLKPTRTAKEKPTAQPSFMEQAFAIQMAKIWKENIFELLWTQYGILGSICRWNGKSTGYAEDADLLTSAPDSVAGISGETVIINKIVESGRTDLKHTMRNWPHCPLGGRVDLTPRLDRTLGLVALNWHCDCGR